MVLTNIRVPHRQAPLTEEEVQQAIIEGLDIVHILIGGYCKENIPSEIIARAHRFFWIQAVPGSDGCKCQHCLAVKV